MSEEGKIICGNVMLSAASTEETEKIFFPRMKDLIAFTGDPTQTVCLRIASFRPSGAPREGLRKLFGAWRENGDEDLVLDEIYRSRTVSSGLPNEE